VSDDGDIQTQRPSADSGAGPEVFGVDSAVHKARLRAAYESLQINFEFVPGQFVKWKPNQKNATRPLYNEPAVVIEVLDLPIYDDNVDAGSPYFRQRLDIVLGVLDHEGDFVFYHFDRRRFQPYD